MEGASKSYFRDRQTAEIVDRAGLSSLAALTARRLGEPITDARSSWVRRIHLAGTAVFVKTYDYPTRRDRLRGALRNTWLAPSRAGREWQALEWLAGHGFACPRPWLWAEARRFGVLHRAVLVTEALAGEPADRALAGLAPEPRDAIIAAIERLVVDLHRAGFRHRNLDLRNLIVAGTPSEPTIAVLDAPRFRLRPPGAATDKLARADWERLTRSLLAAGIVARS